MKHPPYMARAPTENTEKNKQTNLKNFTEGFKKMEIVKLILMLLSLIITFVATFSPLVFKLGSANKARKEAETAAEKEKAYNDMFATAQELIKNAETAFAGFDAVMKQQQNGSAGAMKKKSVSTDLQAYALAHGYEYDATFWGDKIDEIVAFTREVNAKKKVV